MRTAAEIGTRAKVATLVFTTLAACGGLVKAAGGSNAAAIAFAAVGVVGALVALALGLLQERVAGREEREALWLKAPGKLGALTAGDGAYRLGVDTEAPEALDAAGLHGHEHAPYVPRDVDQPLRDRLASEATRDAVSLVVLSGPSKAGKSRTLLEAAQYVLSDAWLIRPRDAQSLARLAGRKAPSEIGPGPCVIWLDDIERFVVGPDGDGLNADTLDGFRKWRRPVLVLATEGGKGRQVADAERFADALSDLLRNHPRMELNPWLSDTERQGLASLPDYSADGADRISREGVGEFMVAASKLRERLAAGARTNDRALHDGSREGLAVTQAAVDWRRVGLIRPVPRSALRALYVPYLPGPDTAARFQRGLEWATTPLYSQVALLQGRDTYEPNDYAVRYETERRRPVPAATWDAILESYAEDADLVGIGLAAVAAGASEVAERAWRRGDERGDGNAAINLGVLLAERGDREGAEVAVRRAVERANAPSLSNLGVLFQERGDLEAAEALYRCADERGDAGGAYNLGLLLDARGDPEGAEAAYRRGDDRGNATAAFNLGVLLQERGDLEGAEAAYRRADERGDAHAASNLGVLLQKRGDPEGAEAAYRRADERGYAGAATNLSILLEERADREGAEAQGA